VTKHNHPVVYGRRVADCPRCAELEAGAAPRTRFRPLYPSRDDQRARIDAIRAHSCKASRCGPVCTAFDW
jgi:hypothetical protein